MRRFRVALAILRAQGPRALARRVFARASGKVGIRPSLVRHSDALAVDWSLPRATAKVVPAGAPPYTVAWIISPPGSNSGGHQNIYRFISFMEAAGHSVRIYLYSTDLLVSPRDVRTMTSASTSFADVSAPVLNYTEAGVGDDVDAIVATGWETAYPAFLDRSSARRLYFVQDFEPSFYPVGTESTLAENTYRFGFSAITAGGWLSRKLAAEYGMTTAHYDFAADRSSYSYLNNERRREIFFYARPGTERRGFELGLMALEIFSRARPDYRINFAGEDVSRYPIPFGYNNLGSVRVGELNAVYNRCAAALVLSMTNMSLLPLELVASGVIPVVNDAPNNTQVSDNRFIEYSSAAPHALAQRLIDIVDREDLPEHARAAAESIEDTGWKRSGEQFLAAFGSVMNG